AQVQVRVEDQFVQRQLANVQDRHRFHDTPLAFEGIPSGICCPLSSAGSINDPPRFFGCEGFAVWEDRVMRVVLTGASGQRGAYLIEALRAGGHDVSAWSWTGQGRRGDVELRPVDLTDRSATATALAEADPEVVLHAAAISASDAVRRDPGRGWAVNVAATTQ